MSDKSTMEAAKEIWDNIPYAPRGLTSPRDYFMEGVRLISVWLESNPSQKTIDAILEKEWNEIRKWKPYLHFCRNWDFLLIDKGDGEFEACDCFPKDKNGKLMGKCD